MRKRLNVVQAFLAAVTAGNVHLCQVTGNTV